MICVRENLSAIRIFTKKVLKKIFDNTKVWSYQLGNFLIRLQIILRYKSLRKGKIVKQTQG